jgi:hypothetical protein
MGLINWPFTFKEEKENKLKIRLKRKTINLIIKTLQRIIHKPFNI